jgi:hypothetical protein
MTYLPDRDHLQLAVRKVVDEQYPSLKAFSEEFDINYTSFRKFMADVNEYANYPTTCQIIRACEDCGYHFHPLK